ncbi:tol-Pal system protein TolA-like [Brassica napus]|uniref:tol-Pal system protein TolA-like n=1 Tax=Brassica napus TaxID=3708 RepID=UPI00207862DD|nr:tol-Pal system protein TolA-like [Brassica napus]
MKSWMKGVWKTWSCKMIQIKADIAVDSWNRILIEPEGTIFWEDVFEMDVRTRPTTQKQSEPHGIFEGQEEERVCEESGAGGEAGRESVKELELRLNKRMDDGFALRDETIRLLAARVKELEQDKIQRENWSFQFGEYETCEASGGKGRDNMGNGNDDGEAVAEKDGEKQVEEEAEKNGTKEAEKDGAKEAETTPEDAEGEEEADKDGKNSESDAITAAVHTPLPTETTPEDAEGEEEAAKEAYEVAGNEDEVGQKEGETEADKEGETEEGKTDVEDSPSTLQVMAEAAEKLEKEVDDKAAAEKAAAEKAADELAAAEKAASDKEKVGDEEETRPKRTHKPSRPLRSPYQKN